MSTGQSEANCNLSKDGADVFRPDLKVQIICQEVDDGMGNVTVCQYYAPVPAGDGTTVKLILVLVLAVL